MHAVDCTRGIAMDLSPQLKATNGAIRPSSLSLTYHDRLENVFREISSTLTEPVR